jgi:hypothetical protein
MSSAQRILGVPEDADERTIKRAYALLVRSHRPDTDPEGFRRVHDAYQQALAMLAREARRLDSQQKAQSALPVASRSSALAVQQPIRQETSHVSVPQDTMDAAEKELGNPAVDDNTSHQSSTSDFSPSNQPLPWPSAAPISTNSATQEPSQKTDVENVRTLATAISGPADDQRFQALSALLAWQGRCGPWAIELVAEVLKRLGRNDCGQLDQVLLSATGDLVPLFMEARAGELRGPYHVEKAKALATAWLRRIEKSWNSESGMPSLQFAITLMLCDRRLAALLAEHARDVLEEGWYAKHFAALSRQEMLASELYNLPEQLQPGIRRVLAGETAKMTTYQRQHALMLLWRTPNRAILVFLQKHQKAGFAALTHPRLGSTAILAIGIPILFVICAAAASVGASPALLIFIGIFYFRSRAGARLGQPNFFVASPAGWVTFLMTLGVVFLVNPSTVPAIFVIPLIIGVLYLSYRFVPSIHHYVLHKWWVFAEEQADLRLPLLGIAVWIIVDHALARWGSPGWIGHAPGFGSMCLVIASSFLGSIAIQKTGVSGWRHWVLAPRVPVEPRPMAILAMYLASGGALLWCDWALPSRWTPLGDLLLIPIILCCVQGIGTAWRTGWFRKARMVSYVLALVVVMGLAIQAITGWRQLQPPLRDPPPSPSSHQFPPLYKIPGPSVDEMLQGISNTLILEWSEGHFNNVNQMLDSLFNEPGHLRGLTEPMFTRFLYNRKVPDQLVIIVMDRLYHSNFPWSRALIHAHLADSRAAISAHAAYLEQLAHSPQNLTPSMTKPPEIPEATPSGPPSAPP